MGDTATSNQVLFGIAAKVFKIDGVSHKEDLPIVYEVASP